MANKVKWAAETPVILASGTQMNGLAAAAKAIGTVVYDNSVERQQISMGELYSNLVEKVTNDLQ